MKNAINRIEKLERKLDRKHYPNSQLQEAREQLARELVLKVFKSYSDCTQGEVSEKYFAKQCNLFIQKIKNYEMPR